MPPSAQMLFVSRAGADKAFADWLCAEFTQAGYKCWVADRSMREGNYVQQLQDAVKSCGAMVVVMSATAEKSDWVANEALYAIECRKHLFIAQIDDSLLPIYLISRDAIDFRAAVRSRGLRRLLSLLGRTDLGTPLPKPKTVQQERKYSPDTNRTTYFQFLRQLSGGAVNVAIARKIDKWARGAELEVEFSGLVVPSLHARLEKNGEGLTVASVLAFRRRPVVEIPLKWLALHAPYDDPDRRLATLDALNDFLPEKDRMPDERADGLPRLPLSELAGSDEVMGRLLALLGDMVDGLRGGN